MGHNEFILNQGVAVQKKRITWIGVDHELVDFAKAEVVLHLHFIEGFPKLQWLNRVGMPYAPKVYMMSAGQISYRIG